MYVGWVGICCMQHYYMFDSCKQHWVAVILENTVGLTRVPLEADLLSCSPSAHCRLL